MRLEDVHKANPNAILIHSGVLFDVFNPKLEDIKIIDIAHALSNLCRYGGHSPKFYSVAQHSVLCSWVSGTPQQQMDLLMHDATEAYLIDVPKPIKRRLSNYVEIEDALMVLIAKRFNLTFPLSENTHTIDYDMLKYEYKNFYEEPNDSFDFWAPKEAKARFLERYSELSKKLETITELEKV